MKLASETVRQLLPKSDGEALDKDGCEQQLRRLYTYCRMYTDNRFDAEDLAHEAVLRVLKSRGNKALSLPFSYLRKAVRDTWIDKQRKRRVETEAVERLPELFGMHEDEVIRNARVRIALSLGHLTPLQTAALMLVEAFGLSIREASQWMGTPEGALKALLHRARKRILSEETSNTTVLASEELESLRRVDAYLAAIEAGRPEWLLEAIAVEANLPKSLQRHTIRMRDTTAPAQMPAPARIPAQIPVHVPARIQLALCA